MMGWTTYSNLEFQLFCYFTDPSYHNCTTYRFDFDVMQGNLALEHIENTMVFLTSPSTSGIPLRSEEHTSELQSRSDLVCRLLLEKKNNICRPSIPRQLPRLGERTKPTSCRKPCSF